MNHIVNTCPLTKFDGGQNLLHKADDDAVIYMAGIYSDFSTHEMIIRHAAQSLHTSARNLLEDKRKVFPYSLPSVGPGADPGVQAVSPQVT